MNENATRREPGDSKEYFLRAEGITKVYSDGTVALHEATLEIHPREIVGLLGENGAGKLFRAWDWGL